MSIYVNYFTENNIDYISSINSLCRHIHSKYFTPDEISQVILNIPSNELHTHTLLDYEDYQIKYLYTGTPVRNGEVTDTIDPVVISLLETQSPLYTVEDKFEYCLFGNNIILKNTDSPRSLLFKMRIVKKDYDHLDPEIRDRLEELLYGLLTIDQNITYKTIQGISNAKKNVFTSHTRLRPNQRVRSIQKRRSIRL